VKDFIFHEHTQIIYECSEMVKIFSDNQQNPLPKNKKVVSFSFSIVQKQSGMFFPWKKQFFQLLAKLANPG